MASILRVNTLTDASSNNSVPMATVASGSAKVLGQKNTAGTSIDATLNVSSLDDDGTGDSGSGDLQSGAGCADPRGQGICR